MYHGGGRTGGIRLAKKISCCTQCNTTRGTESSIVSLLLTIRDRSFDIVKLLRISLNRWTTSFIVGRLDGSTWIISAISGCMNSKPRYLCVPYLSTQYTRQRTIPYLQKLGLNCISNVKDIGRKGITRFIRVLKFRDSFITSPNWHFQRCSDWWVVTARQSKVD